METSKLAIKIHIVLIWFWERNHAVSLFLELKDWTQGFVDLFQSPGDAISSVPRLCWRHTERCCDGSYIISRLQESAEGWKWYVIQISSTLFKQHPLPQDCLSAERRARRPRKPISQLKMLMKTNQGGGDLVVVSDPRLADPPPPLPRAQVFQP